jgi:hypothetical protein
MTERTDDLLPAAVPPQLGRWVTVLVVVVVAGMIVGAVLAE